MMIKLQMNQNFETDSSRVNDNKRYLLCARHCQWPLENARNSGQSHEHTINAQQLNHNPLQPQITPIYISISKPLTNLRLCLILTDHDDVIKWKHFPRYWPFVGGIHRSLVNSPDKGQWRRALMFSLICVWIKGWVNNHEAGDLRRYRTHYDVTVMPTE